VWKSERSGMRGGGISLLRPLVKMNALKLDCHKGIVGLFFCSNSHQVSAVFCFALADLYPGSRGSHLMIFMSPCNNRPLPAQATAARQ
jgi:hypothetical protein